MISPRTLRKIAKSYAAALAESKRSRTEFSREYWKGKSFGIVETYAEMADLSWKKAEDELRLNMPQETP